MRKMTKSKDQIESKKLINNFLKYLEKTQDSEWLTEKCADTPELKKCCVMGHLFKFGGGNKDKKKGNQIWDDFEYYFATTYMIFPVNDGKHKNYQQATPKQRCIAYLKDLRDGIEETSFESVEKSYKCWLKRQENEQNATKQNTQK